MILRKTWSQCNETHSSILKKGMDINTVSVLLAMCKSITQQYGPSCRWYWNKWNFNILMWQMTKVHYFTDGCEGQYENNYKTFAITVKRPATKASLKRPAHNQILTPLDMFSYCESDVTGIKFFYMSSTTIKENWYYYRTDIMLHRLWREHVSCIGSCHNH